MKRILKGLARTGARLKESLGRTREALSENVQRVLAGRTRLDEETLEELEEVLIGADVGVTGTELLLDRLRERASSESASDEETLQRIFREELAALLTAAQVDAEEIPVEGPRVVLLVGVNGTGKTTTLGKLAHFHRSQGQEVVAAAADTFRAAAVEQLRVWTERAGVELVANESGADPASVAFDAVSRAEARGADVVLVDTAGRLQTKVNLMQELEKIARVVGKKIPGAPHEVLLVLDATTGQNALSQARQFREVAGVTGIVLTKMDGTARGGMVVAIAQELGIPVRYLGLGEAMEDLAPFDAEAFAEALFTQN